MLRAIKAHLSWIIAAIGLIVAALAIVPDYIRLDHDRLDVVFRTTSDSVQVPDSADNHRILALLHDNNIPSGRVTIEVSNRGRRPVKSVRIGMAINGEIVQVSTRPNAADKAPWIEDIDASFLRDKPTEARVDVSSMAPGHTLQVMVDFKADTAVSTKPRPEVEVFADGQPAKQVFDLVISDDRNLATTILPIVAVLLFYISFSVWLINSARRHPGGFAWRVMRTALLMAVPIDSSKQVDRILGYPGPNSDWAVARDEMAWQLATSGCTLKSMCDGQFGLKDPKKLWDLHLTVSSQEYAVCVITSSGAWHLGATSTTQRKKRFLLYCLNAVPDQHSAEVWISGKVDEKHLKELQHLAGDLAGHSTTGIVIRGGTTSEIVSEFLLSNGLVGNLRNSDAPPEQSDT